MDQTPAPSYPTGFYFELSFKGEDAAFQEVSGMSKELGIEEVVCGGINNFKYKLPTVASNQNLVLKRALVPEGSQLVDWCSACMDMSLQNVITTHDVSVTLLNPDGSTCIMWTFHNAYPVKYSVSDLKSQDSSVVIESMELAYTFFEVSPDTLFGNLFD